MDGALVCPCGGALCKACRQRAANRRFRLRHKKRLNKEANAKNLAARMLLWSDAERRLNTPYTRAERNAQRKHENG
jgi:hypothetical protein